MADEFQPTLAIDFDGTIAQQDGWEYPEMGPPFHGVAEAIQKLKDQGFKILIYTCRLNQHNENNGTAEEELERLTQYLDQVGVPFDDFVVAEVGKPFAEYYIDDKGIRFNGDWNETVKFVESLQLHKTKEASERVFRLVTISEKVASRYL